MKAIGIDMIETERVAERVAREAVEDPVGTGEDDREEHVGDVRLLLVRRRAVRDRPPVREARVHAEVDADFMPLRNKRNDYLLDRTAQKETSFTGIEGVSEQDAAIQDSQGPIQDRTREHLGPTDVGIVEFRKMVMAAARALQSGTPPKSAQAAKKYAVRAGGWMSRAETDFADVLAIVK